MVRHRVALPAALLVLLALAFPAPAAARGSFCTESGDTCITVQRRGSDVLLRVATSPAAGSSYRLCVRAPDDASRCRRFALRERGEQAVSTVRWTLHFPNRGRGAYRVRWDLGGGFLPALTFRRR